MKEGKDVHHGAFCGSVADKRQPRILILGESHHISTDPDAAANKIAGVPATYTTHSVVEEYLGDVRKEIKSLRFFEKIAKTFGVYASLSEERTAFWEHVYFGNYIDVLCGIGNGVAKEQIKKNREKYNNQLFQFVNEHKISRVFCFSILAYNSLPELADNEESTRETVGVRGNRRVFLRKCVYKAGVEHGQTDVILRQELEVYGIGHPSARGGYDPQMYVQKLSSKI